ncbi:MAG: hypothetical protein FWH31_06415 [Streptococcaceae bacterium]|nr:hypothetical protein [Streptococcaceae bacterium]
MTRIEATPNGNQMAIKWKWTAEQRSCVDPCEARRELRLVRAVARIDSVAKRK